MADSTDYKKWVDRDAQDLRLLEVIRNEGLVGIEDSFCYICHQAAEKMLKAFLIKSTRLAPKSHDLLFLLGKCISYESSLLTMTDALTIINEYSVSARYPDDFDEKRTVEDAREAYCCIIEVKKNLEPLLR